MAVFTSISSLSRVFSNKVENLHNVQVRSSEFIQILLPNTNLSKSFYFNTFIWMMLDQFGRILCGIHVYAISDAMSFVQTFADKNKMAVPLVNEKLLCELEEMGFPPARATRALYYSGNSSLEAAVSWIVDHETDPDIDEMPFVPVNIDILSPGHSFFSERVNFKAEELRNQGRKRLEEEEKKREREKERIRVGKELQEAKQIVEENERKRFQASRKAEKEEEKRAREKIVQKLQQDKMERRGMLGLTAAGHSLQKSATTLMREKNDILSIESMRNCLRSLKYQLKDNDAKVRNAFQTLYIYARNITNNPDEENFRKIRVRNPAFLDRVGAYKEGIQFLELCGFEKIDEGQFLHLPRDKVDLVTLKSAMKELHSALTNPLFGLLSNRENL